MRMKRVRFEDQNHKQVVYVTENGGIIKREYGKHRYNDIDGRWVYRNAQGRIVEVSAYRTDIFDKYQLIHEDQND